MPMYCNFYDKLLLLGTAERDGRYSGHIDEHCARCGQVKTDGHLLFTCSFARSVWFLADLSLLANRLPEYITILRNLRSSAGRRTSNSTAVGRRGIMQFSKKGHHCISCWVWHCHIPISHRQSNPSICFEEEQQSWLILEAVASTCRLY